MAITNSEEGGGETLNSRIQEFISSLFSSIGGVFGSSQDQDSAMASRAIAVAPQQQQPPPPKGNHYLLNSIIFSYRFLNFVLNLGLLGFSFIFFLGFLC